MDLSGIRETLPEVGEPSKSEKVCVVCQAPADKSCSACHQVAYCSAEHQKSDWKEHKKDCPPIRIVTSPELGPHFVVTRDLPPGTLLLTELPVLVIPFILTLDSPDLKSCISCRSILPTTHWDCFQCSTPYFCNLSCSMNKIHTEFECGILSKCSVLQRSKLFVPPNLGFLRAIHLKNSDPETWTKLLELEGANQYKPEDADVNNKCFIREILPLVGEKGEGFEADLFKLKGIHQQKGIVVYQGGRIHIPKEAHGTSYILCLRASNFAQNCFPNCTSIIGKGPKLQLEIRTTVGLKKGDIPSIDYRRVSYEYGAMTRQHMMNDIKGALCICPRCTDPTGTELGTMLSAVKCEEPNCNDGYLLPVDVKDMADNAPWRCNGAGCKGNGSTWEEIKIMIQKLEDGMQAFRANVPLGDVDRTVEFLATLKKKLHPNHWLILSFKNIMTNKIDSKLLKGMGSMLLRLHLPIPAIQLYISMIEDMLKMTEFTAPGLSKLRGDLWRKLFHLLYIKLFGIKRSQESLDQELMNEFKRKANEAIDQLCSFAKFYPDICQKELIEMFKKGNLKLLQ